MRVYQIKSTLSPAVLAEIRVEGDSMEFIVDNTEGVLPRQASGSFKALKSIVDRSSHMEMVSPDAPAAHLVRYTLSSGDVAEITTDGLTCIVNGKILSESEKLALFNAIRSKKISVARRDTIERPVPVPPAKDERLELPKKKPAIDPSMVAEIQAHFDKLDQWDKIASKDYDPHIENTKFEEWSPENRRFMRKLMYAMKYGE